MPWEGWGKKEVKKRKGRKEGGMEGQKKGGKEGRESGELMEEAWDNKVGYKTFLLCC